MTIERDMYPPQKRVLILSSREMCQFDSSIETFISSALQCETKGDTKKNGPRAYVTDLGPFYKSDFIAFENQSESKANQRL